LSNNNKRDMLAENAIGQAKTRNPLQCSVKKTMSETFIILLIPP
jgi:hypothetical protein